LTGEKENKDKNKKKKKKKYFIEFHGSKSQYEEIKNYFDSLQVDLIIFGLRFSYNRNKATVGGFLNPGRKSIVKRETQLLTSKQAQIRIKNWKIMIKRYREKGYSYPTISRIKKQIIIISKKN
jgi:predicted phosphodiesterase